MPSIYFDFGFYLLLAAVITRQILVAEEAY